MVHQAVPGENRCEEDRQKSLIHRGNLMVGETNKKEDGEVKHTVCQMVMSTMERRGAGGETGDVGPGAESGGWGRKGHPRKPTTGWAGSIPESFCCHPLSSLVRSPGMRSLH